MNPEKSKLVELTKISEMGAEERKWLQDYLRVEAGYFEVETGNFIVSKVV
ncbi:MAG: hypothetical protein UU98_C0020G0010 [Parcubacteria group bacterium GW2011_GWD2_42_14]|nr:MAG: hypothetical protein UU98_C0020G0010 [Parcubacteria group bacterium GW2011_GWD2_42_14]